MNFHPKQNALRFCVPSKSEKASRIHRLKNHFNKSKVISNGVVKMGKRIELKKGEQFGRLRVIRRAENNNFNRTQYLCQCICGNQKTVKASNLVNGDTRSCGCLLAFMQESFGAKRFVDLHGK